MDCPSIGPTPKNSRQSPIMNYILVTSQIRTHKTNEPTAHTLSQSLPGTLTQSMSYIYTPQIPLTKNKQFYRLKYLPRPLLFIPPPFTPTSRHWTQYPIPIYKVSWCQEYKLQSKIQTSKKLRTINSIFYKISTELSSFNFDSFMLVKS